MPSRQAYREVLQLSADLWRIPFALCITTLVFFVKADRADIEAAYRRARVALGDTL